MTKELADTSGVNKRAIDHYLMSNPQEPSVTNAVKIAQALNVSVEYLVTGKESSLKLPLTHEMIDFINTYSALTPRQREVVTQLLQVFTTT